MWYRVNCAIQTPATGLECEIEIGYLRRRNGEPWQQNWTRIGGRLDIRDDDGNWMTTDLGNVMLVSTAAADDPYWSNPANSLVLLRNVPERFPETIRCGEFMLGEGKLYRTEEIVRWKMWLPCS